MFYFQDVIGVALPMIGSYGDLDNTQQVVALIDEVGCPHWRSRLPSLTR